MEELSLSSDYAQIKHHTMYDNNRPLLKDGHDDHTDNIGIMNRRDEHVQSLKYPSRQLVVNNTMKPMSIFSMLPTNG